MHNSTTIISIRHKAVSYLAPRFTWALSLLLFTSVVVILLILTGCAPKLQEPIRLCPGAESVAEALSVLRSRSENTVPLRANGRCLLRYYAEGKKYKENFAVKLWVNPPAEIYMQGDVAFNPKGLVLGSNEDEFWLAIRPKEISGYWWGRWSEEGCLQELMISPKTLLEALGIAQIGSEEGWSLSNEGTFDVLTKRNEQGAIIKKIYIFNSRDYPVRKIEYFDTGQVAVVAELDKYKDVHNGFFVPTVIKLTNCASGDKEDSVKITLSSVKPANFTEKAQRRLFTRPQPRGFEHIYKIVDGDIVEE